jgi:hypothetical protein
MFTFALRPGHKSKELLIEFRKGSGSDEMVSAMKQVLAQADFEIIKTIDFWQNDEMIYKIKSKFGNFELSSDNWGCMFIMAPDNQPAIKSLAALFSESASFQAEVVDFAQYT